MVLLKASIAMVRKYYVFQQKFAAYNVNINKNFGIISFLVLLPGATIPTNLTRIPDYLTKTRFSVISCSEKNFHPLFRNFRLGKNFYPLFRNFLLGKKLSPAFLANPSRKSYNFFFS